MWNIKFDTKINHLIKMKILIWYLFFYLFYFSNNDFSKINNLISCYFKYMRNDKQYYEVLAFEFLITSMKNA
jgi:hypothetical protein